MKAFAKAVREQAARPVWDQGIKLARAGAVHGESQTEEEVVLRVRAPGRGPVLTVVLYPQDGEWDCNCGRSGVCSHVAAALVTMTKHQHGDDLPVARGLHSVRYRLSTEQDKLTIARFLVNEDGEEARLTRRLTACPEKTTASSADLSLDLFLTGRPIHAADILRTFTQLSDCSDIYLHGKRVKVSHDEIPPKVTVRDKRGGVELAIERDPLITEVVSEGVGLLRDTLHPLSELDLTGPQLEALPFTKFFGPEQLGHLVTELLPELSRRVSVDVKTDKLPGTSRSARARILFAVEQDADELSVLPTLVYGDPPQARVDDDKLVHIAGDIPVRDRNAERRLAFQLRDELNMAVGRRLKLTGREAIQMAQRLSGFAGGASGISTELFHETPLDVDMDIDGDQFDVAFRAGDKVAEPAQVLRAWRAGQSLVPLMGGGWAPLPENFLQTHGHLIADLLGAGGDGKKLPVYSIPDLAALCRDLDYPAPPSLKRLEPLLEGFEQLPQASTPADLNAELRPYQETGVRWLSFLAHAELGGILADDMGLGKTIQALCTVTGRTLVVCPTSVLENWRNEAKSFRPSLSVSVYHGAKRQLDADCDLTVTTYALLRQDIDKLGAVEWDTAILDEAQHIKNPESQVAQAAYKLKARRKLTLTGTPIENRLDELWSQFHFTNPGLLGGRADFRDRYSRPIADGDPSARQRLRRRIRPFVLRRVKSEVAPDLPPRTEQVRYCELTKDERATYSAVLAAARNDVAKLIGDGKKVNTLAVLEALLRMRQAACHQSLLPGRTAETSSKVELLLELLESISAEGHKALVFSQWTSMLNLVEPHLAARNLAQVRLDGATRDRQKVVDAFQSDDGPPVMLLSLKAGGTGLNLTAADHVILLDPWWNPAVEAQAADRAHRIGQDKPVFIYRLVAKDTVEEQILKLQDEKRALFEAALGDAGAAGRLTREDLLALIDVA